MAAFRGLQALFALLEILRPTLTAPGFAKLSALVIGWVRTTGRHAVTEALVASGISGRVDHERFHRFFSRGAWDPDEWCRALLRLILRLVPEGEALRLVLDDTLAAHKGPEVFGLGTHLDAVRSTRLHRVFCFGHVWVVLAVLVRVPFSRPHLGAAADLAALSLGDILFAERRSASQEDRAGARDARPGPRVDGSGDPPRCRSGVLQQHRSRQAP